MLTSRLSLFVFYFRQVSIPRCGMLARIGWFTDSRWLLISDLNLGVKAKLVSGSFDDVVVSEV